MSNKHDLLAEVMRQEDAARALRNATSNPEVEELAGIVARLAQAVRAAFEPITTSSFKR